MGRVLAKRFFGNTNLSGLPGDSLASIAVGGTNNAYVAKPAMVIDAPTLPGGVQATAAAHMGVVGITNFTAGTSGYVPAQTLTLTGGTGTAGTLTVSTTRVNGVALVDRGVGYAPTNLLTLATGTGTAATATVDTTRVKTVAINTPGTGFDVVPGVGGTFTGTIATGTGTSGTVTVTYGNDGIPTGAVILTAGSYTANPTLTNVAVTGGSGADLTLDLTMEIGSISGPTGYGSYTANPTLTAGATTGTGTGATLTVTMGVLTAAVATAGDYTVLPADVSIVPHSGGGTGALFNLTFKVVSVAVTNAGLGYASAPAVVDNPDGNATFIATLTTAGENAIIAAAFTGGTLKVADIKKQSGSRRYRVTTSDGDADCYLKATTANAVTQMNIMAYDAQGCSYFVTKLTRHHAVLTRGVTAGTGFVWATGASVNWWFDAADATHAMINNA